MRKTTLAIGKTRVNGELFWRVTVPKQAGGRIRKTFRQREEALAYFEQCKVEQENFGTAALSMPESLRVEALECAGQLEAIGATLRDATAFYIEHFQRISRSQTVKYVIGEFIEAKKSDGASKRYLGDLRVRLARFGEVFGETAIAAISPRDISGWLRRLEVGAVTRNTFRRRLAALFNFARRQGYLAASPIQDVEKAREREGCVGILSPEQVTTLLRTADRATLPYWAIGAFAGLRRAEIERLDWSEIDMEESFIEIKAAKAKTASRRLVPIQPNLRNWLQPYLGSTGPVCPPGLRKRLEADLRRVGFGSHGTETEKEKREGVVLVPWPQNALRHGYGSYRLAVCQDAAKVSLEMGNSPAMVFRHYRELVRPVQAEVYWNIQPTTEASAPSSK